MNRCLCFVTCLLAAPLASFAGSAQASPPAPSPTPTVDQIIARHIEARGGLARIKAIQSLKSVGHIHLGPMVMDLRIDNPRRAFRAETSFQGLTKIEAFDGAKGWIVDPFTGKGPASAPEPMNPDQLKQVALQMDFDGPLVDVQAKGHRVALLGTERVDGSPAYVLKISLGNGDELLSYLDVTTLMEVRTLNKAVSMGKVVEVETALGDYRAVKGVLLPFSLTIRPRGQSEGLDIRLDQVEADKPMDPARFAWPR